MQSKYIAIWHPVAFIVCNVLAVLVYASWFFPPTRALWDGIDETLFFRLNGTLQPETGWSLFWAYANTKAADISVGLVMILFYLVFCFSGDKKQRSPRLATFGFMSLLILLTQDGGLANFYVSVIDVTRLSPSLALEPVVRLSELYPHIDLKDASGSSFPGDHGIVILVWLSCIWVYAGWRWGLVATVFSAMVLLPRMVAGAHWLTDNLVGSFTLVMLMNAWLLATPVSHYLLKLGRWILRLILPNAWSEPK